ncbi:uncharacterized protein DUF4396 [Breoghania corrubedonensis]|uniref:Uncharacterized protein DUF4396 n=1 Tax=Breoghania corrubedonensis TaxID=665038 RepID=A0A2T5VD51_9HYPH|nr:DUF4396 domain-containing protein [Breoghania corrubedonensis]PTW61666.1 uncharacterized protein DUF4396 [Breoghania corrubedonensis]
MTLDTSIVPLWLHALSLISLALGLVCCVIIAVDEVRDPQHMWIMNLVWPVVALFASLMALWGYYRYGKSATQSRMAAHRHGGHDHHQHGSDTPFAVAVGKGASHCGAGCTIGDIIAEPLVALFPAVAVWFGYHTLFSEKIFAVWVLDFILAFAIGIAFQYFAIKPMRGLSVGEGLKEAVKADALSLTSWQIGMYGFMAIAHFWLFAHVLGVTLSSGMVEFWFMMQIAMLCGFATAYPVNWWLIRAGIKEAM